MPVLPARAIFDIADQRMVDVRKRCPDLMETSAVQLYHHQRAGVVRTQQPVRKRAVLSLIFAQHRLHPFLAMAQRDRPLRRRDPALA